MSTDAQLKQAEEESAREAIFAKLEPFLRDPASMAGAGFLVGSSAWPEGAELNDMFPADESDVMLPMAEIRLRELPRDDAARRLVNLLCEGLAYGMRLTPEREAEAAAVARDLVEYFGPEASWQISEEDWQIGPHGGKSKMCSTITEACTFSAMLMARNARDVLVVLVFDED